MATKVGGFTKSGVVQCVKLVEEGTSSKLSSFNGTFSSSNVTCNNGFVITGYKDGTTISTDFDNIRAPLGNIIFMINPTGSSQRALFKIYGDVVNGDVATASLEPELWAGSSAEYLPTNSSDWTSNENFEISQIIIQSTGGSMINQYVPVLNRIHLSFNGQSVMYEKYAGSNPQTYYYNPTDTKFILYAKDRVTYSTVSISKSGVLKCKELIEESSSKMFSGTVDSNVITLNNGMKITFTYGPSDTPAGYTQTGSYLSFKDSTYGTPFLRLDINNTSTDKRVLASITNEEAWNSSEDLSIGMISGSIGAAVPSAPCKWVIEYKGQTDTYSISSRGPIITNAVGGNTLITSANRTPTVRVYKDGTIKCAEVEEATVTAGSNGFEGTVVNDYISCTNGYKMYFQNKTTSEKLPFSDLPISVLVINLAPGFNDQISYTFSSETHDITGTQFQTYSPDDFLDEHTDVQVSQVQLSMNSIGTSFSEYNFIIEPPSGELGIYDSSVTSSVVTTFTSSSGNLSLPYIYRNTFTWPGSTIAKAVNTFITSDDQN